ncbi:MaoC family dehydratase [Achromobacter sp. ACM02]|uniref:MaoC family dehydratase n=1 Tax=Achromobacter sp. ACM02 TaxID=2769305 RepID=UPI00177ACDCD|nr:MaoC family dehydratase [Achromobacter sp. ACM02]MBD9383059.1 MaoC family dehydratase [Achromobacter sp. ACM02]
MASNELFYDDFEIGRLFPPSRYSIGAADSDAFIGTFEHTPVLDGSGRAVLAQGGAPVRSVHPVLVGSFQPQHAAFAWPIGVLHAREKVRLLAPVYPGEELEASVLVKDKYLKNDKRFVVLEITVRKLENARVALVAERSLVWPN